MNTWGTIAVAVRLGRGVDSQFVNCWTSLISKGLRQGDSILTAAESPHHQAAESLFDQFLDDTKNDAILLIDDDMIFASTDLAKLRETGFDYDILSALYVMRRPPHAPIVVVDGKLALPEPGIMEVSRVGFGFTLIRRHVAEAIRKESGSNMMIRWSVDGTGEDFCFCEDAKKHGCKIGVNCDVKIGHRFPFVAYWDSETKQIDIRGG